MKRLQIRTTTLSLVLTLAAWTSGCESQLDNKVSAKTAPASQTKADASEASDSKAKAEKTVPAEAVAKANVDSKGHVLDASRSQISFVGAKVTGDHEGGFKMMKGTLRGTVEKPESFEIEVDMGSLWSDAEKLTAHLKNEDFFEIERFTSSGFKSTSMVAKASEGTTHEISGDLSLHGVTKQITFPATIEVNGKEARGKAEFKINRKDFGIEYQGMADNAIKDEVLLKIDLAFVPATS